MTRIQPARGRILASPVPRRQTGLVLPDGMEYLPQVFDVEEVGLPALDRKGREVIPPCEPGDQVLASAFLDSSEFIKQSDVYALVFPTGLVAVPGSVVIRVFDRWESDALIVKPTHVIHRNADVKGIHEMRKGVVLSSGVDGFEVGQEVWCMESEGYIALNPEIDRYDHPWLPEKGEIRVYKAREDSGIEDQVYGA